MLTNSYSDLLLNGIDPSDYGRVTLIDPYQSWDFNNLRREMQLPESPVPTVSGTWEMEKHWCTGMVPTMLCQLIGSIFPEIWCMLSLDSCSIIWPVKMLAQGEEIPTGYTGILADKHFESRYTRFHLPGTCLLEQIHTPLHMTLHLKTKCMEKAWKLWWICDKYGITVKN